MVTKLWTGCQTEGQFNHFDSKWGGRATLNQSEPVIFRMPHGMWKTAEAWLWGVSSKMKNANIGQEKASRVATQMQKRPDTLWVPRRLARLVRLRSYSTPKPNSSTGRPSLPTKQSPPDAHVNEHPPTESMMRAAELGQRAVLRVT